MRSSPRTPRSACSGGRSRTPHCGLAWRKRSARWPGWRPTVARQIALVDRANQVRPRTWSVGRSPRCGACRAASIRHPRTSTARTAAPGLLWPARPARLRPRPSSCARCGAGPEAVDGDGFCAQVRVPAGRPGPRPCRARRLSAPGRRERPREAASPQRGRPGPGLGAGGDVLVVCDGVSSSQNPDAAATAAAAAACAALAAGLESSGADDRCPASWRDPIGASRRGRRPVRPGALRTTRRRRRSSLAVRRGRRVAVGWVGDSRAYYLAGPGHSRTDPAIIRGWSRSSPKG